MELRIKTLKGSCTLSIDLQDTKTVGDLQTLLHQHHKDDPLAVPQPEQQQLVRVPSNSSCQACMQHAVLPVACLYATEGERQYMLSV
jgi:hypothetical protein